MAPSIVRYAISASVACSHVDDRDVLVNAGIARPKF